MITEQVVDTHRILTRLAVKTQELFNATSTLGATELKLLTDVDNALAPNNGDVIKYVTANSQFEAVPIGALIAAMDDLTDATITSVTDNELLQWDSGTSQWINQTFPEANIALASTLSAHTSDATIHFTQAGISITESQINDLQTYSLATHTHIINDLADVNTSSVVDGDLLSWDSGTSKWINGAANGTNTTAFRYSSVVVTLPSGTGIHSLAIGDNASTGVNDNAMAVGRDAIAQGDNATAFGKGSNAAAPSATMFGSGCIGAGVGYGNVAQANEISSGAFGNGAHCQSGHTNTLMIGQKHSSGTIIQSTQSNELRIGTHNTANCITLKDDGKIELLGTNAQFVLPSYVVASLPTGVAGGQIFVTDETGGAVPAFYDGTNWRRVTDRVIVS